MAQDSSLHVSVRIFKGCHYMWPRIAVICGSQGTLTLLTPLHIHWHILIVHGKNSKTIYPANDRLLSFCTLVVIKVLLRATHRDINALLTLHLKCVASLKEP